MRKRQGISVRLDEEKIQELDKIARLSKRDRSFVISEAIDSYLHIHKWQIDHIKKAMSQANMGEFASEVEVKKAIKKWQS
jgi:RHH-type transcriptional regulator, rel operon repressor / antitoxin RelB